MKKTLEAILITLAIILTTIAVICAALFIAATYDNQVLNIIVLVAIIMVVITVRELL